MDSRPVPTEIEADNSSMKVDKDTKFDYDLIVIGGGSGGVACAKAARDADTDAKIAILDYVEPSPQGSQWGFGGTCVNVGCIPKYLFKTAAKLGSLIEDAKLHGWSNAVKGKHDWEDFSMVAADVIGQSSWAMNTEMQEKGIDYINALGSFVDKHTIETLNRQRKRSRITGKNIVIATGGRPTYPDVPGAREHCITSDDIWTMPKVPGKTLVVGAAYIALECASFIHGLGYDTTVCVRSILLRGFDQEIAEKMKTYLKNTGIHFIQPAVPKSFEKMEDGRIKVTICGEGTQNENVVEFFDTVLLAVGRTPNTSQLNLEKVGIQTMEDGKLKCVNEQTNVDNIYAIGDVLYGRPELTPVAAKAGTLLARRLMGVSDTLMSYEFIPTSIFTAMEYAACGLTEEDAMEKYGEENVEVYHTEFQPHENDIPADTKGAHYVKMICSIPEGQRVVGLHILGHHAGEMMQGYAVALKMGATYSDFSDTIALHVTSSENIVAIKTTKRSGVDVSSGAGCST